MVLNHKSINVIPINVPMFVELNESPSTGYCWYYTVSNASVIAFDDKKSFNFNKPNIVGGNEQIIWKFVPLEFGECKIHFTYYKSWKKESFPLDEYTYIVKVE